MNTPTTITGQILLTVKQLAQHQRYPWLTEAALRHLIFQAEPRFNSLGDEISGNGLDQAIIRLGRKVLIDLDQFDAWINAHRCGEET